MIIFFKVGAGRFPNIPPDTILIEMDDGSIFRGKVEKANKVVVPTWLQRDAPLAWNFINWVLTAQDERFMAIIKEKNPLPFYDPSKDGPEYVYIRIGELRFISARNFKIYHVKKHNQHAESRGFQPALPAKNFIYMSIRNGDSSIVYNSIIHDYTELKTVANSSFINTEKTGGSAMLQLK